MRMTLMAVIASAAITTTGPSHAHVPKHCSAALKAWNDSIEPSGQGRDIDAQAAVDYRNNPTEANWQKLMAGLMLYIAATSEMVKKGGAFLLCTGMPAGKSG